MFRATTALGLTVSILAATFVGTSASAHPSKNDKAVVIDKNMTKVMDARGNCVITKYDVGYNGCGDVVMEEKKPVAPVASSLTLEQKTVYFDFDKSHLDAAAIARLDRLAAAVRNSSDVKSVKIVGYADYLGTDAYNQRLSERRSDAVKRYLRGKGIYNTSVEQVRALGERTASPKCQALKTRAQRIPCLRTDRRVEIEIEYQN